MQDDLPLAGARDSVHDGDSSHKQNVTTSRPPSCVFMIFMVEIVIRFSFLVVGFL